MPRKGAPKSFAPGTVMYIPYFGRVHEIIVQECQTGMHWGYVNVLFKNPPEGRFVNPRGVRRNACFTSPKFAMEAAMRSYKQRVMDEERHVKYHQKIINALYEEQVVFLAEYRKQFQELGKEDTDKNVQ